MRPMLATPGDARTGPPSGPSWAHEIKWDGIRAIYYSQPGDFHIESRNLNGYIKIDTIGHPLSDQATLTQTYKRPNFGTIEIRVFDTASGALRQQLRTKGAQLTEQRAAVYDYLSGVAHHPTAVRETLQALRAKYTVGRLVAVFEPRSATSRLRSPRRCSGDSSPLSRFAWITSPGFPRYMMPL